MVLIDDKARIMKMADFIAEYMDNISADAREEVVAEAVMSYKWGVAAIHEKWYGGGSAVFSRFISEELPDRLVHYSAVLEKAFDLGVYAARTGLNEFACTTLRQSLYVNGEISEVL